MYSSLSFEIWYLDASIRFVLLKLEIFRSHLFLSALYCLESIKNVERQFFRCRHNLGGLSSLSRQKNFCYFHMIYFFLQSYCVLGSNIIVSGKPVLLNLIRTETRPCITRLRHHQKNEP